MPTQNGGSPLIIPGADKPGREILNAAAQLMAAFCKQYPGAVPELMGGTKLEISGSKGVILRIEGRTHNSGLILPGEG